MLLNKENDSIKEIIYAKIGNSMDLAITSESTLTDFNLKFKNNNVYPVIVEFAKLILGS
jgi:hypothetical protein